MRKKGNTQIIGIALIGLLAILVVPALASHSFTVSQSGNTQVVSVSNPIITKVELIRSRVERLPQTNIYDRIWETWRGSDGVEREFARSILKASSSTNQIQAKLEFVSKFTDIVPNNIYNRECEYWRGSDSQERLFCKSVVKPGVSRSFIVR